MMSLTGLTWTGGRWLGRSVGSEVAMPKRRRTAGKYMAALDKAVKDMEYNQMDEMA